MRIRGSITKGLLIALALSVIPAAAVSAQKITPGSICKVNKQKVTYQSKVYTCVKSGKKLVWNKGAIVVKPTPTPTPTPTHTPIPTPTPTVTPTPTRTRTPEITYKTTHTPTTEVKYKTRYNARITKKGNVQHIVNTKAI